MNKTELMWAPWRFAYVKNVKKSTSCILCKAFKSDKDERNLVVYRSKHCFVILNKYPYNNGHIMVTPNRHISGIDKLTKQEVLDINDVISRAMKKLTRLMKPQGFNLGMNLGKHSGAGIKNHIHTHIVPRWDGDTNFMPVISDVKVISQSLDSFYSLYKNEWSKDEKVS